MSESNIKPQAQNALSKNEVADHTVPKPACVSY